MRMKILMVGVASLGLAAAPAAFASGNSLGSSGNGGNLLGGGLLGGGGQQHGAPHGGQHGGWNGGGNGGHKDNHGASSSHAYKATESSKSSKEYSNKTYKQNDTTIGGFAANPQLDISKSSFDYSQSQKQQSGGGGHREGGHKDGGHKSGGHPPGGPNGGGSSSSHTQASGDHKSLSASFPIQVNDTTIGGFEKTSTQASSNRERNASVFKAGQMNRN